MSSEADHTITAARRPRELRFVAAIAGMGLVGMFACELALATPDDDLRQVLSALASAKSFHVEERFYNGKTVTIDYSAPDRWRLQPAPNVTELVVGDDVYMVTNGQANKLPFGGGMVRTMVEKAMLSARNAVKDSSDLGMQTLEGHSVHVYSFTHNKVPQTIYVGSNRLPVRLVINGKEGTTTIDYSHYNEPVSIDAP